MDYLWTPWRYQYVTMTGDGGECIFCAAAQASDDKERLVVHRATRSFVILNRFPYTSGHLMIVPYEHVAALRRVPARHYQTSRPTGFPKSAASWRLALVTPATRSLRR